MRQVLVISGKDNFEPLYNNPAMDAPVLLQKLSNRKDVKNFFVGDGSRDISIQEIEQTLSQMNLSQPITIIMQCHGTMKEGGFKFVLGKDSKISSEDLFKLISLHIGNNPIDLFTPACYGGGMLRDANLLPDNSVLVSLTSEEMLNNGVVYSQMVSNLDKFDKDFTGYNLLQFYVLNFLKSRFEPSINITGKKLIDLNEVLVNYCKSSPRQNITVDSNLFGFMLNPEKLTDVVEKLNIVKYELQVYASEYGIALGIMLNEVEKEKHFFTEKNEFTMQAN